MCPICGNGIYAPYHLLGHCYIAHNMNVVGQGAIGDALFCPGCWQQISKVEESDKYVPTKDFDAVNRHILSCPKIKLAMISGRWSTP